MGRMCALGGRAKGGRRQPAERRLRERLEGKFMGPQCLMASGRPRTTKNRLPKIQIPRPCLELPKWGGGRLEGGGSKSVLLSSS